MCSKVSGLDRGVEDQGTIYSLNGGGVNALREKVQRIAVSYEAREQSRYFFLLSMPRFRLIALYIYSGTEQEKT